MTLLEVTLLTVLSLSVVRTNSLSSKVNESLLTHAVNYQLPSDVSPISYEMEIILSLMEANSSFDGISEIEIKVLATTKKVTLHAKNLVIGNAFVFSEEGEKMISTGHTIDNVTDFLTINFNNDLETRQKYTLFLEYRGLLSDTSVGFFRSSYNNSEGEKVWFAATDFEPFGARQAFPCFDEPALKATFSIAIKHPKKYHALSNMHIKKKELASDDSEQMWTTFSESPTMSTYLVAFVISDFVKLENKAHDFRIWARKEVIENGKYALGIGLKILKFIEQYTGIWKRSTQFLKLDNVAIPGFKNEAMENWGLVTYKEGNLLVKEGETTMEEIEFVAFAMAHELTHQWFGNLVTPKSWQYIWLNEGLANYFQAFFADMVEPDWKLNDLYVVHDLQTYAFDADSDANKSFSMNHRPETPDGIREKVVSPISYYKAGSIFRMISHVLTETKFKKSLRRYLRKMSHKAATPDDLINELTNEHYASGLRKVQLREALNNWVNTPGFPVITVTRNYTSNEAVVTQNRFLINENPNHRERYWVPINYAQKKKDFSSTTVVNWFNPNDTSITILGLKSDQWVIFNKQHFGYYRVNYDNENWKLIIRTLNSDQYEDIHILNRGQLLDDAFKLAETSRLNWSIALEVASYLEREKNFVPWESASAGFFTLSEILHNTKHFDDYRNYVLHLLEHLEETIGYEISSEDDHPTKYLKNMIKSLGCRFDSEYCKNYAYSKIEKWLTNSTENPYPEDVFCSGLRDVNQSTWNELFDKYLETGKAHLAEALACSSDQRILENYMKLAVNSSITINKSRLKVIWNIFTFNRMGAGIALNFIIKNFQKLTTMTGNKTKSIEYLISCMGPSLNTQEQIDKFKAFAKAKTLLTEAEIAKSISSAEARIRRIKFVEEELGANIGEFFDKLKSTSKGQAMQRV